MSSSDVSISESYKEDSRLPENIYLYVSNIINHKLFYIYIYIYYIIKRKNRILFLIINTYIKTLILLFRYYLRFCIYQVQEIHI